MIERTTGYSGHLSNSDVPVASRFHTTNAFLIIPSTTHILRPSKSNPSTVCSFPIALFYALRRRAAGRQFPVPFSPVVYSKQKIALRRRVELDLALSGAATIQDQDKANPTNPRRAQMERVEASHRASVAACGYLSCVSPISGTHLSFSLTSAANVCDHAPDLTRQIANSGEHSLNG